ncbi:BrnA antitoxin family protein, partial [Actinobacillus seminis]|uniref:BrnA antitoxin family protein n=1 Tax=Actinobacillus seminis TaxID=722 RepID=UPI003B952982
PYNPAIKNDDKVRELTDADFARMKPLAEVMPPEFTNMALTHQAEMEAQGKIKSRKRGKQKAPTKQSITIRLSPEVIVAF